MKAYLLPYDASTRYGFDCGTTCIALTDDKDNFSVISLRHCFGLEPSHREMEIWREEDMTAREFREATMSGDDYESEFALETAQLIVAAINKTSTLIAENRRLREALEAVIKAAQI